MRYVIKAYTLTADAKARVQKAIGDGLIRDPEDVGGFVEGTCATEDIDELVSRGLDIRPVSQLPDDAQARAVVVSATGSRKRGMAGVKAFGIARPKHKAVDSYYRVVLRGAVTSRTRARLAAAGAPLLERRPDGSYTSRSRLSSSELEADPAVVSARPFSNSTPARPRDGKTVGLSFKQSAVANSGSVLEALLQPGASSDELAKKLQGRGAEVMLVMRRAVRFAAGKADVEALRAIPEVAEISPVGTAQLFHDMVRQLVGIPVGTSSPGHRVYRGENEIVGIADTGLDVAHPDFKGRIIAAIPRGRPDDSSDPNGHGTHVAGTIAGDGTASGGLLAGMAPAATIFFQSVLDAQGGLGGLPLQLQDFFQEAYDAGVRVHNNSWGAFLHSRYSAMSLDLDEFVHAHPDFLPVVAAGNDGSCLPGVNSKERGMVDYPSTSAPASAKNCLTVGASRSSRTGLGYSMLTHHEVWPEKFPKPPMALEKVSGDSEALAGFSARGPCDDMRIKPDVVAPGTDIASTRSAEAPLRNFWGSYPRNSHYALMGGTSMACPVVTGIAVITRQFYRDVHGVVPSAALLKATIINGATPLTGVDAVAEPGGNPGPHQGAGRVDLATTIPLTEDESFALAFSDNLVLLDTGDAFRFVFDVVEARELRICLVWTDPPNRGLQNALMMQLVDSDGNLLDSNREVFLPMAFTAADPFGGIRRRDPNNNVHSIRLKAQPGAHELFVVADNLLFERQAFAVVVTGAVRDFKLGV